MNKKTFSHSVAVILGLTITACGGSDFSGSESKTYQAGDPVSVAGASSVKDKENLGESTDCNATGPMALGSVRPPDKGTPCIPNTPGKPTTPGKPDTPGKPLPPGTKPTPPGGTNPSQNPGQHDDHLPPIIKCKAKVCLPAELPTYGTPSEQDPLPGPIDETDPENSDELGPIA